MNCNNNRDVVTRLIHELKDTNPDVRMDAAEKLGELKSKRAVSPLSNLSKDPDALVRICVAESLGDIKSRKAIPVLLDMLKDKDELVRGYAAEGLGMIGDKSVIPVLEKMLREEKSNATKLRLYTALYRMGQQAMLESILGCLEDHDYGVRCAAANTLCEIVEESNAGVMLDALERALQKETTISAKSSISNSIQHIKKHWC